MVWTVVPSAEQPSMQWTVIASYTGGPASSAQVQVPLYTGGGSNSPVYQPGRHVNTGPNAGAIAGGVVGGVAVIAIAVVAIFWIKRRHPRKQVAVEQSVQPVMAAAPRASHAPTYSSHESFAGVVGDGERGVVKGDRKGDEEFEEWNERDLKQNAKI